jgi:ABC-type uncharacterized transport system permease subunit
MARRPLRVALALIAGGFWDWMVHSLKQRFKVNQVIAVMIVAFVVDIIGSFILVTIGVSVASLLTAVPVWGDTFPSMTWATHLSRLQHE